MRYKFKIMVAMDDDREKKDTDTFTEAVVH